MISTEFSPVCCPRSPSYKKMESHNDSGTSIPLDPEYGSEAELYQVITRPKAKYFMLGPELTVLSGVTKRILSVDATSSPPPALNNAPDMHYWGNISSKDKETNGYRRRTERYLLLFGKIKYNYSGTSSHGFLLKYSKPIRYRYSRFWCCCRHCFREN